VAGHTSGFTPNVSHVAARKFSKRGDSG